MDYIQSNTDIPPMGYKVRDGNYVYRNSFANEIWIEGGYYRNCSKGNPYELFVSQCKTSGANISELKCIEDITDMLKNHRKVVKEIKTEEYQNIIDAEDVDDNKFAEIIESPEPKDKYKIEKFLLRRNYRFDGTIDVNFMNTYANKQSIKIFKNLNEIVQYEDVGKSLEGIQLKYQTSNDKIIPANNYIKHKIAIDLLKICGFSSLNDAKIILRKELLDNILANRKLIEEQMGLLCFIFGGKKPLAKWELPAIMKFINGILESMYGFNISVKSKLRNDLGKYVIKHKYLGITFDKQESEIKPYVEFGWKQKINENNDFGFLEII